MKLFEVTNDYMGESYVKCYVIAETEERALEMAREQFKKDNPRPADVKYYENLKIQTMRHDTIKEWCGEVRDS